MPLWGVKMHSFMVNLGECVYEFTVEITPTLYQWNIKLLKMRPWTMSVFSHMT